MHFDRAPLGLGQLFEGVGQLQRSFIEFRSLAGGRLIRGEPVVEARRRVAQIFFDRLLARNVAFRAVQIALGVGQVAGENLARPRGLLSGGLAAKFRPMFVSLQERLLDDIRCVELRSQPAAQLTPSQQAEVGAKWLQTSNQTVVTSGHPVSILTRARFDSPGAHKISQSLRGHIVIRRIRRWYRPISNCPAARGGKGVYIVRAYAYHSASIDEERAMRRHFLLGLLIVLASSLCTRIAWAQGQAQAEIVVPTISTFTVGTTVSVPDRGGTYLGGVRRASDFRTETFPRLGRGFASSRSASDASVHVWIHDFQEMEEALGKGTEFASRPAATGFTGRMQEYAANRSEKRFEITNSRTAPDEPVVTKPNRDEERIVAKADHAADMLKRGQDAEARGKLNVAKLYYKSVVRLGSDPSARTAQDRLAALETKIAGR